MVLDGLVIIGNVCIKMLSMGLGELDSLFVMIYF